MEEKPSLRANFTKSVRCKAQKLGVLFADALGESEKAAKERGHLATRTDHAFVGCNPCPPGDMVPPVETVTNIAAIPRPSKRDR